MKLNRDGLFQLYTKWVDRVSDDIPEKTIFYPSEIVNAISNIIESNPSLIELPSDEEIEKALPDGFPHSDGYDAGKICGFEAGAKWMKEQILNQNK